MFRRWFIFIAFIFALVVPENDLYTEEGMYPISEIHKLKLKSKGLQIDAMDIFNPDGISLIDGIVQVGGCSGSFVSVDGLILTNHHCAYRAIQTASSAENDYIKNGFIARNRTEEFAAKGYTARITESYRDVSKEVLSVVNDKMDLAERTKAIEKKIKQIVKDVEKKQPGKRAEVSEMFIGKTYVLFIYTYLKDVRLVYAPPRSIGEFGGDVDNWEWPRHTGDFSFMRAYVAPDGSPADYSPDNIPYTPKKVLQVAPAGVDEGDFVFILGYPGRTARHQTSHFVAFEETFRLPYVVDLYNWQISFMEKMGENDHAIAIKHASRIKGLANVEKRARGKLKGLRRVHIVDKKREQEHALQQYIESDKKRKEKYGKVLVDIGKIYEEIQQHALFENNMRYLRSSSNLLSFGYSIYESAIERQKVDIERESAYMERNFDRTKQRMKLTLKNYYEPTDKAFLKEMFMRLVQLPETKQVSAIADILLNGTNGNSVENFIDKLFSNTKLTDKKFLMSAMEKSPEEVKALNDPFIQFAEALYPTYQKLKDAGKRRTGALAKFHALLIDVKKQFLKTDFIPDANRTLRLTYGHIRGYSPADAVTMHPITTLGGVLDKTTGKAPFDTPQKIFDLYKARDFGRFKNAKLNDVPVCILYDMDTTGGNSGSAVFNARGQIVGVNFDRAFEATINDYAWNESYSRSIAVDIRYVLWVTQKFGGADFLLQEMNVEL